MKYITKTKKFCKKIVRFGTLYFMFRLKIRLRTYTLLFFPPEVWKSKQACVQRSSGEPKECVRSFTRFLSLLVCFLSQSYFQVLEIFSAESMIFL